MPENIRITISGDNQAGATFTEVRKQAADLRKDLERPIEGPAVKPRFGADEQSVRDRVSGMTRGLRKRGDAYEDQVRFEKYLPGRDLTQNDLIREQNDRFRATRGTGTPISRGGGGSSEGGPGIGEKYGELAAKLVALHGVLKIAEAGVEALDIAVAKPNTKRAAEGWIAFSEAIGRIPIVGAIALSAADKLTGGALNGAKKALADAEEIDKRTEEMAKKWHDRRAEGEKVVGESSAALATARRHLAQSQLPQNEGNAAVFEFQDKQAELSKRVDDAKANPNLGQSQREQVQKNAQAELAVAQQALWAKLNDIDSKGRGDALRAQHVADAALIADKRQSQVDELNLAGRHADARLQTIKNGYDAEIDALYDKLNDEQKGLEQGDWRFTLAQDRFNEAKAAADGKRARDEKQARQDEQNDRIRDEQSAETRILDLRVSAAATRLKTSGDSFAADKLIRDNAYKDQIEAIRRNEEDQIRAHAERAPEIRKRAEEEVAAAGEARDANEEAANKADAQKFRVKGPAAFAGESRLLTGVGSSADPLLEPTKQTAKTAVETKALTQKIADGIAILVANATGGATFTGAI